MMPTVQHDAAMYLMRRNPGFGAALLEYITKKEMTPHRFAVWSGADLSQPVLKSGNSNEPPGGDVAPSTAKPKSRLYLPDTVVCLRDESPANVAAILAETQRRPDAEKRYTWPQYLVFGRSEFRCPTYLLVIATDAETSKWCATPIEIGQDGFTLIPVVVNAATMPDPEDPAMGEFTIELTVLAVVTGRYDPSDTALCQKVITALDPLGDGPDGNIYMILVSLSISGDALKTWRAVVTSTEPLSHPIIDEITARGKAEGEAFLLMKIIEKRRIELADDERERVRSCRDTSQLELWADRALTADNAQEIFGPPDRRAA